MAITVQQAVEALNTAGFSVALTPGPTVQVASPAPATQAVTPAPPRRRQTRAERSAVQPRVKHCSTCGATDYNAATHNRAMARQAPQVDLTTALLDGLPPAPTRSARPLPPAPAENGFLDLSNLTF